MKENDKLFGFEVIINNTERGIYPLPFTSEIDAVKAAQTFEEKNAYKVECRENGSLSTKTITLEESQNYLRYDGSRVQLLNGVLELCRPDTHK